MYHFFKNIRTYTVLLVLILSGNFAISQNYQYELQLDKNDKLAILNVTNEISSSNRFVTDTSIMFESQVQLDEGYFTNLADQYGYELLSFSRSRVFTESIVSEKGTDCPSAEIICTGTSFSGNNSGFGTQELNTVNDGCLLGGEHQSAWYYVNVNGSGTLDMTINPDAVADYDFALWGPYTAATAAANCPPTVAPTRCNFADLPGGCMGTNADNCADTGLDCAAANNSEGAMGAVLSNCLNVTAGEVYILLIDNFSSSSVGYTVSWGGTSSLRCTPVTLPVELGDFRVKSYSNYNEISWNTLSELNNDYFIVEKSSDGTIWRDFVQINGAGTTSERQEYQVIDDDVGNSDLLYYRLKQYDYDGNSKTYDIVSIENKKRQKIIKTLNLIGQEVDENYKGIVIHYMSDGSTYKSFNY